MTRILLTLIMLAVPFDATAQPTTTTTQLNVVAADSGPADLRLTGPATGAVAQPLTIVVSGLPAVDLGATVGAQTKWIDSLRFDVSTPDAKPATLDKELSMSVSPWEWRLRLTLTPASPGVYLIVCDWNQEPFGLALHRVTVGGTAPTDPTKPPPDQPPNPIRKCLKATYLYEKDQTAPPKPVQSALQQLNAGGSVVASSVDDDVIDGSGEVPDQFKVALAESKKTGLPVLVVEFSDGTLKTVKDPKTAEQVAEAVKP